MKRKDEHHVEDEENQKRRKVGEKFCYFCENSCCLSLGCSHYFCDQCVGWYFQKMVIVKKRSFVLLSCPSDYCSHKFDFNVVKDYFNEETSEFVREIMDDLPKVRTKEDYEGLKLVDFGYKYDEEGKFCRIKDGKSYFYINENHYDAVSDCVVKYIQDVMKKKYNLIEDFCDERKKVNIFYSNLKRKKLLILIIGSGKVKCGQWARSLCINDSLRTGSCLEYVDIALKNDYDVILLNPNVNSYYEFSEEICDWRKRTEMREESEIEGNCDRYEHTFTVYDRFVKDREYVEDLFIVAHSAGGYCAIKLLKKRPEIYKKLTSIAFTDSVHHVGNGDHVLKQFLSENTRNWERNSEKLDTVIKIRNKMGGVLCVSAGHERHENTSSSCVKSVFKYFNEKFSEKKKIKAT